jgi:hypothetical protein
VQVGDLLQCDDGGWQRVDGVRDTGTWQTVYNVRVSNWHTYFVGEEAWRWSLWVHNAEYAVHYTGKRNVASINQKGLDEGSWVTNFEHSDEGIAKMARHLEAGPSRTGARESDVTYVFDITDVPRKPHGTDPNGGIAVAEVVPPERIVALIPDTGNPDMIHDLIDNLKGKL